MWFVALSITGWFPLLGRRFGQSRQGIVASLVLLYTSTTFISYISDGKTDLFAAATGLAFYCLMLGVGQDAPEGRVYCGPVS